MERSKGKRKVVMGRGGSREEGQYEKGEEREENEVKEEKGEKEEKEEREEREKREEREEWRGSCSPGPRRPS